jgi:predicted DNA-binding protein (UPF0251 family)
MQVLRTFTFEAIDPLRLADAFGISREDTAVRLGISTRRLLDLNKDPRHVGRVRRAVLEIALERERTVEAVR